MQTQNNISDYIFRMPDGCKHLHFVVSRMEIVESVKIFRGVDKKVKVKKTLTNIV